MVTSFVACVLLSAVIAGYIKHDVQLSHKVGTLEVVLKGTYE
jgi:hypothetical protein